MGFVSGLTDLTAHNLADTQIPIMGMSLAPTLSSALNEFYEKKVSTRPAGR